MEKHKTNIFFLYDIQQQYTTLDTVGNFYVALYHSIFHFLFWFPFDNHSYLSLSMFMYTSSSITLIVFHIRINITQHFDAFSFPYVKKGNLIKWPLLAEQIFYGLIQNFTKNTLLHLNAFILSVVDLFNWRIFGALWYANKKNLDENVVSLNLRINLIPKITLLSHTFNFTISSFFGL